MSEDALEDVDDVVDVRKDTQERRRFSLINTAKRWAVDWSALLAALVAIVTIMQVFSFSFPLVWAADFNDFKKENETSFKSVKDGMFDIQITIQDQTLRNTERELRARRTDREKLAEDHQPVPAYLDDMISDLSVQVIHDQDELSRLKNTRGTR